MNTHCLGGNTIQHHNEQIQLCGKCVRCSSRKIINNQFNQNPTTMSQAKLFQYAVIFHPTEKQKKDENMKSKLIGDLTTVLAENEQSLQIRIAMDIPQEYKEQLSQIEIVIRPF